MITAKQFQRELDLYFGKPVRTYFTDARYSVITLDSLVNELIPYYNQVRSKLLAFHIPERKDCDDRSLLFIVIARLLNSQDAGTAFGALSYTRDDQEPHSIPLIRTDKGIVTVEPLQQCRIINLSPSERASVRFFYA